MFHFLKKKKKLRAGIIILKSECKRKNVAVKTRRNVISF